MRNPFLPLFVVLFFPSMAQVSPGLSAKLDKQSKEIEQKVIGWRRHFHEYPELSNREFKTGKFIAEFLASLGMQVQYPVAGTGVVGILKGAKPGSVVALRADMDGLPVTERNALPFASSIKVVIDGSETGVMHACGHDGHMAILMGVAEILAKNKTELYGTVKFIFQPAEESLPPGEEGGASLMIKEGVLKDPDVEVIFGLHIQSLLPAGELAYRPEGIMAAVDELDIKVTGIGAHGATPWDSVDPIVITSEIINGLQTIVSRQADLTSAPAVITVGRVYGGIRRNIIPEEVNMEGTIRTLDPVMRKKIHEDIRRTAVKIAESAGATAAVRIAMESPITYNDPKLTASVVPSLQRTVGTGHVSLISPVTMAEDFSFYQEKIPGFFFFLGAYPGDQHLSRVPVHHTADFVIDEKAMETGVRAMLHLTADYLYAHRK